MQRYAVNPQLNLHLYDVIITFCLHRVNKVQLFQETHFLLGEGMESGVVAASTIIPLLLVMAIGAAVFIKRKQVMPYVISVYNKHGKALSDIS